MKNIIEAREGARGPRSSIVQPIFKPKQIDVFKCEDCLTEVKISDMVLTPAFCPYCGSVNIGFDRSEQYGSVGTVSPAERKVQDALRRGLADGNI